MVGMLQIITYLLCVYLFFKAVEIFQIALVAPKSTSKGYGLIIGVIAVVAAFVAAGIFTTMIDSQALKIGSK